MKPWEETWEATPYGVDVLTQRREHVATFASDMLTPAETERARACLGATAPEMYRLLAEAEWSGGARTIDDASFDATCAWCGAGAHRAATGEMHGQHNADCRWASVMKKAQRP